MAPIYAVINKTKFVPVGQKKGSVPELLTPEQYTTNSHLTIGEAVENIPLIGTNSADVVIAYRIPYLQRGPYTVGQAKTVNIGPIELTEDTVFDVGFDYVSTTGNYEDIIFGGYAMYFNPHKGDSTNNIYNPIIYNGYTIDSPSFLPNKDIESATVRFGRGEYYINGISEKDSIYKPFLTFPNLTIDDFGLGGDEYCFAEGVSTKYSTHKINYLRIERGDRLYRHYIPVLLFSGIYPHIDGLKVSALFAWYECVEQIFYGVDDFTKGKLADASEPIFNGQYVDILNRPIYYEELVEEDPTAN